MSCHILSQSAGTLYQFKGCIKNPSFNLDLLLINDIIIYNLLLCVTFHKWRCLVCCSSFYDTSSKWNSTTCTGKFCRTYASQYFKEEICIWVSYLPLLNLHYLKQLDGKLRESLVVFFRQRCVDHFPLWLGLRCCQTSSYTSDNPTAVLSSSTLGFSKKRMNCQLFAILIQLLLCGTGAPPFLWNILGQHLNG